MTNTGYGNLSQVESELSYLGISNIRENTDTNSVNTYSTLMGQGIKVDLIANPPGQAGSPAQLSSFVSMAHNLEVSHPGMLVLEGLNEVDNQPPTYEGLTGYAAAAKYQQDLYTQVKADPTLAKVPVYNLTLGGEGEASLGNLSAYCDYANVHIYYSPGQPSWGTAPNNTAWSWSGVMSAGQVDAPGKPTVVTETGMSTATGNNSWTAGVDQPTQAKEILNSLMDSAKYGDAMTYIYELDESQNAGPADMESHFGLYSWGGAAKLAAVAIHNLTSILRAGGPLAGTPGSLDYSVSGVPSTGGQLLFEQGDGRYDIVVWAEPKIWDSTTIKPIAAPNTPVSVTLATAANVSVYDPLTSASPVQSLGTTSQVNVNVTDHPIIIEVTPNSTPGGGSNSGSTYTATAATISSDFDSLNGNQSVSSIVISDNAAVTLSVAQLQNDVHALGELKNANGAAYKLNINDTGAHISSALSTLAANSHLASIKVTDGAMVTVANSQYAADTAALNKISGAHTVEITGYTGTTYTAQDLTYDAAGALSERTYHNTDGTLSITGLEGGLTFQSGGQKESISVSNTGDTFVFKAGFAAVTITGYHPGSDVLDISSALAASASAVASHAYSDGHGGTLIDFGQGQTIDLIGVLRSQIHNASDLHFI